MSDRYVQIRCRGIQWPFNSVVSQETLKMDDGQLDEFVAAGYAIEFDPDPAVVVAPEQREKLDEIVELSEDLGLYDEPVDPPAPETRKPKRDK